MITVAVDYTPAIRQSAGIGRIIRGQIQALVRLNPGLDLRLFVVGPAGTADRTNAPLALHATPVNERNMIRLWHRLDCPWPHVDWFTGGPVDLFHATDFVLAPSGAARTIVTVHDLAFLYHPEAAMPSLHHYLNVVVPRSVRRADHLIADSHHTAHDLEYEWHIPADRISVVQGAVDHTRFRPLDDLDAQARVRKTYGIGNRPYIMALSRLEPRKNFARLIEAYHIARQDASLPHLLVIGGAKGWMYDEIFDRVQQLHLEGEVLFPGFIADDDLPILYRAASCFAYPSLYEGFGLPILEALACGTPVLTGANSCLVEAGGPGAYYVDVHDVSDIANGLVRLLTDSCLRASLRTAGFAHAGHFTWERSARQLLRSYQKALSRT